MKSDNSKYPVLTLTLTHNIIDFLRSLFYVMFLFTSCCVVSALAKTKLFFLVILSSGVRPLYLHAVFIMCVGAILRPQFVDH